MTLVSVEIGGTKVSTSVFLWLIITQKKPYKSPYYEFLAKITIITTVI